MIRYIQSVLRHSKLIIVLIIAITIFMLFQITRIDMDTDVNTLMPTQNERILKIKEELNVTKEVVQYIFISIRRNNENDIKLLQDFQTAIDRINAIPEIEASLSPFNFISFERKGRRIGLTTIAPEGRSPTNAEEMAIFEQRIKENSLSDNFITADHSRILTAAFINTAVNDVPAFIEKIEMAIEPLQDVVDVYYTGEVLFQNRVAYYLKKDFSLLLVLVLIVILFILWLSFHSRRAIFLPILVVTIGVIWTLGCMALLDFSITIVSVIIPSMVLAIGSSYTIHILSEYYRSSISDGISKTEWLAEAVAHILHTVIVSALTTIISFLSLLSTTLQSLREFGLSIGLGIFFCAILALFFLPAILHLIQIPKECHRTWVRKGRLTKIVSNIGLWAMKHHVHTLPVLIIMCVLFLFVYPRILHKSDYFSYFSSEDPLINSSRFINKHSGGSQTFNITLTAPNNQQGYFLNPEILSKINEFELIAREHPSVTNMLSFNGILRNMNRTLTNIDSMPDSRGLIQLLYRYFKLIPEEKITFGQDSSIINEDASRITIYFKLAEANTFNMINENDVREFLQFINQEMDVAFGNSLEPTLWGNTLLVLDSTHIIKRDQIRSMMISILLGMLVTWIFFRSFLYSVIALMPLISGMFFYYITLYLFKIPLDMTTILVTNVTVGVGLDDAVHFILQYRKQRQLHDTKPALSISLLITGRAIVLTTASLVAGLLVLCAASFTPIVFFGLLIAGTLFATMAGTIILIPAAVVCLENICKRFSRCRIERML